MTKKLQELVANTTKLDFVKKITDLFETEYTGLYNTDLESDYIQEMLQEQISNKQNIIVGWDKNDNRFRDILNVNWTGRYTNKDDTFKNYCISFEGLGWRSVNCDLSEVYIITDLQKYADYLLAFDQKEADEKIATINTRINQKAKDQKDMIRLGLKFYEERQLRDIRKIETIRGAEVKAEEVRNLLTIV